MALNLTKPYFNKLFTLASTTSAATSGNLTIPIADAYTFYLNVLTAQTTCNVNFQTSVDGGTTYVNIPWVFAAITTVTGCFVLNVKSGLGSGIDYITLPTGTGAQYTAGTAQALQCVVDPAHMALNWVLSGTTGFNLYCAAWTRASGIANE
jgi:hypothetical protein